MASLEGVRAKRLASAYSGRKVFVTGCAFKEAVDRCVVREILDATWAELGPFSLILMSLEKKGPSTAAVATRWARANRVRYSPAEPIVMPRGGAREPVMQAVHTVRREPMAVLSFLAPDMRGGWLAAVHQAQRMGIDTRLFRVSGGDVSRSIKEAEEDN